MRPRVSVLLGAVGISLLWLARAEAALVAYYGFEEGAGTAISTSVGSFHLSLNNTATPGWSAGKIGAGAYTFSGLDWAEAVGSPLNGAASFSVSWWMDTLQGNKDAGIISSDPNAGARFMIWRQTSAIYAAGTSLLAGSSFLNDGQWHHYALTKEDGVEWNLYRDGIQVNTDNTAALSFVQGNGPLRLARHANTAESARWPGTLDDLALWNEAVPAQTVALMHGLGKFMGTVVNDPAIDTVRNVFDAGPGNWDVAGDQTWAYASAAELLSPATLGATGGQASRNAYIVLDAAGNGVQVVHEGNFTTIGAGTGIAYTSVDTVNTGPRTNVDRGSSLILEPGSYEAMDFSFAYGQSGAAIPFLARWIDEGEYEILAVGDPQTVTGSGLLTVDFGGESRFVLDEPTRILAGFTGVNGFDNPVSYQNGTPTGTSHRSGAVSAVVGQTVSGFSYLNLGRTYAFAITVVPEPSSIMILAALVGLLAVRRRQR